MDALDQMLKVRRLQVIRGKDSHAIRIDFQSEGRIGLDALAKIEQPQNTYSLVWELREESLLEIHKEPQGTHNQVPK